MQKGLRALSLLCFSVGHSTVALPSSAEAYFIAKIQYCGRKGGRQCVFDGGGGREGAPYFLRCNNTLKHLETIIAIFT